MATSPSNFRFDADLMAEIKAMAYDLHSNASAEVRTAVQDRLALWRAGKLSPEPPPARPSLRTAEATPAPAKSARVRTPRAATAKAGAKVPVVKFAAPETPAGICPPHPKARVHKGLCGACGHQVGTEAVA